jgi:hypothetical protein
MKGKIENILGSLIGLPLTSIGRACDLEWLGFGDIIEVIDHRGNKKKVEEYALHIQCAWRLTGSKGIIVASQDRYCPRTGWGDNEDDFDWDVQGENRCDQLTEKFLEDNKKNRLTVQSVKADRFGGFVLTLENGVSLEGFPDGSTNIEHWRFFKPYSESQHFVITSDGIKEE